MTLKGKTLFITGASRGIGKAIGLRAARDGANVEQTLLVEDIAHGVISLGKLEAETVLGVASGAEGKDGGDKSGNDRPDHRPVQERSSLAENRVRASPGKVAPHPAYHHKMREEHHRKAHPQRAGRPGKSAADGVDSVKNNERAAPNAEARHEPPEARGRNRKRAHGPAPSIATSGGNARTRPSAMAPVITV